MSDGRPVSRGREARASRLHAGAAAARLDAVLGGGVDARAEATGGLPTMTDPTPTSPKLHFISGLPRSGSTLLAGILRQNPRFHAAMTGPVADDVRGDAERDGGAERDRCVPQGGAASAICCAGCSTPTTGRRRTRR